MREGTGKGILTAFFSLPEELQNYHFNDLKCDLSAALSVAMLTIPQSMAYALLAGLPLSCGFISAIFASLIATALGSSRYLVVGPSNAIAILLQSGISEILYTYYRDIPLSQQETIVFQLLIQLTLLVGVLQILAAIFRLGRLTQFVSHSVVVGYLFGAAIAVIINQLYPFLGISQMKGFHPLYEKMLYIFTHLQDVHLTTAAVGLVSLGILIGAKKYFYNAPSAVLMIGMMALIIYVIEAIPFNGFSHVALVKDTGSLESIGIHFFFTHFDTRTLNMLLPFAFALALLSLIETSTVAKAVASSTGQKINFNQEVLGIGAGNLLASFIGGMPISGSPSRSSLNIEAGAKTRLSAIFNCVFVALIAMLFWFLVDQIPLASISALLLVTAGRIVKKNHLFLCLKATKADAFVFLTTFLSCLFLSLDVSFYIGVFLSITFYLKKASSPHMGQYTLDEGGYLKHDKEEGNHGKEVRLVKVEGELFFGAADVFHSTLKSVAGDKRLRVLVLQLKDARDLDATACLALLQLHQFLLASKRHLILCGITHPTWDVLSHSGVVETVTKENLFLFEENEPHLHMIRAYRRARELIKKDHEKASSSDEAYALHLSQMSMNQVKN